MYTFQEFTLETLNYINICYFLSENHPLSDLGVFMCMIYLCERVPFVAKKRTENGTTASIKPTFNSTVDNFLKLVPNSTAVAKEVQHRQEQSLITNFPLQPFILAVGSSWVTVEYYYLYITKSLSYSLKKEDSITGIVNKMYKIIWALLAEYSYQSRTLWELIQEIFYETESIKQSPSVQTVLGDLDSFVVSVEEFPKEEEDRSPGLCDTVPAVGSETEGSEGNWGLLQELFVEKSVPEEDDSVDAV